MSLLQLVFPTFCSECKILINKDEVFCANCLQKIKPVVSKFFPINSKYKLKVFAVCRYENPLKNLILKKSFSQSWASVKLAQLILNRFDLNSFEIDYFIPVPLHWTRFAKRGFNQAEVLAKTLGKNLNKPVLNLLKRKKRTPFQSSLPIAMRAENVKDAFYIRQIMDLEFLKDKNIFLIDDLCTTGATLQNAAKILVKYNPQSINAIVACRF
ncbi:MAG: ComF family protein [bacterium]